MTQTTPSNESLTASKRNSTAPVWDMSQERVFIEQLLNQRFNFFLVIFSVVVAGAINAKQQLHLQVVLTIGVALELTLASLLARSQEKLDLILTDLFSDPTHPAKIINDRSLPGGSRRRLVGVWIPRACCLILLGAATLAWLGLLQTVSPASSYPCCGLICQ